MPHSPVLQGFGVLIALVGLGAVAYGFSLTGAYGSLCENFGGKWASVSGSCVTRACFSQGTCGKWAHPITRCDRLRINDPIEEVYFQLGDPDRVQDNRYTWHATKEGPGSIVAIIENQKLRSLNCAA